VNYQYWSSYIWEVADQMGLRDWRIDIGVEGNSPDTQVAGADHEWKEPYPHSQIRLAANWESQSAEDQRIGIVHELLHVMLIRITAVVEVDVKKIVGLETYTVLLANSMLEEEILCYKLSHLMASLYPLPELPHECIKPTKIKGKKRNLRQRLAIW
jgi:hypothetical protein